MQEVGKRLSRMIEASMGLEVLKNHVEQFFLLFFFPLCSEVGQALCLNHSGVRITSKFCTKRCQECLGAGTTTHFVNMRVLHCTINKVSPSAVFKNYK